jgi:serine/threonine protein kinase/thioredoxin-like negative regulator of GroEL
MNSEPDDEDKSLEGQTLPEVQRNYGYPARSNGSPSPVNLDLASNPPDLETIEDEQNQSVLVAHVRTIVAAGNQSQYGHFVIEIGADGQPVELGRGAMGVTYRAIDTTLQRPVALKVISSRLIGNEVLKSRFIREARAAASLRHPNVASVFYLGSTESTYFYAMELVTGETLEQFIANQGPLDPALALDISAQVTSALVAAHQAGLVHRDIKPANLILTRDEKGGMLVKVIDFGLVKLTGESGDGDSAMSDPGTFVGTPRYASPEQFSGGKIDIRSDLYAVGVTLWHMLTKATPFNGTPTQVAAQHLQSPLPIRELRHLPHPIVSLLAHLLEKNPEDRPQTPEELLVMLNATRRAIGGQLGVIATVPMRVRRRWPSFSRGKMIYLAGALIVLVAGTVLFKWFFPAHAVIDRKSVAVLPFDNLGDDSQNAYLSDGITAEVIFQLSRIADLRVISRDSVLRYKAVPASNRKSMREIANELEVATLLESNIQRSADRLKVRSVLYDASSGKQLWSQSYDREMNDLFAIQSDVAENIADALQVTLSPDQRHNIQRQPTANPTAYDLYLRGREYYELRRREDNEKAIALFKQAIGQDSKFALAYAGLANCYIELNVRFAGEPFWVDSAIDLCRAAIAVDGKQARVYTVLARAMTLKNKLDEARQAVTKALELAPNDIEANFRAASQLSVLSPDRYARFLKCRSLDPNDPRIAYMLGDTCVLLGDSQRSSKWFRLAIRLENDPDKKRIMAAEQLVYQKNYQAALNELQPLPPKFVSYGSIVEELRWGCLEHLGRWPELLQMLNSTKDIDNEQSSLIHLTMGLDAAQHHDAAQSEAKHLLALATESSVANPDDIYAGYFVAFCYRFLGEKDQAYTHLRRVFPEIIGELALGRNEYSLKIFSEDREMQELMEGFERDNQTKRAQNRKLDDS